MATELYWVTMATSDWLLSNHNVRQQLMKKIFELINLTRSIRKRKLLYSQKAGESFMSKILMSTQCWGFMLAKLNLGV